MILNENNVQMRPHGRWKRKYKVNEHYFKTWSNNMAYILGFFCVDGMVAGNAQLISFSQKEKYILKNIKKELNSTHPIIQNKETGVYILNINSMIMKKDMMTLHCIMPNKANDLKFPNVPDKYLNHFVRGYFDGDGYVNYEKYTVTFVGGSKRFMKSLGSILENKLFRTQSNEYQNNYRVHIRGRKSIKQFPNWIYNNIDENLYLKRKYKIFKKENLPIEQLKDGRHIKTKFEVSRRKLNFITIFALVHSVEYASECIGVKISTIDRWIADDIIFKNSYNYILKHINHEKS